MTIGRFPQQFKATGSHVRRLEQGQPRATIRNHFLSGNELRNLLQDVWNMVISSKTIRRGLHEFEMSVVQLLRKNLFLNS